MLIVNNGGQEAVIANGSTQTNHCSGGIDPIRDRQALAALSWWDMMGMVRV